MRYSDSRNGSMSGVYAQADVGPPRMDDIAGIITNGNGLDERRGGATHAIGTIRARTTRLGRSIASFVHRSRSLVADNDVNDDASTTMSSHNRRGDDKDRRRHGMVEDDDAPPPQTSSRGDWER